MGLKIKYVGQDGKVTAVAEMTSAGLVKRGAKKSSPQMKPQAPEISLLQPGRLRVANMMSLFGVSRTTFYAGMQSGRYPPADGKDGRLPYWNTDTVRKWLERGV